MARRIVLAAAALVLVLPSIGAQQLTSLEGDFETFFDALGRDLLPHIQQGATSGEGIGASAIPSDRSFYVAGSLGAVFSDGLSGAVEDADFEVLNAPNLIDEVLGDLPAAQNAYEELLPYPIARASFGIRLPHDVELIAMAAGVPGGLSEWGLGLADVEGAGISALNLGLRGRMPLMGEGRYRPGLSAGLGYTYSGFNISYEFPDEFSQQFEGTELSMEGELDLAGAVHTAGVDLTASKSIAFFVPYFRLSTYYQASGFTGLINDFDATSGTDNYQDQGGDDPESTTNSYDFAIKSALGFELSFGGFGILAQGSYSNASEALEAHMGARLTF